MPCNLLYLLTRPNMKIFSYGKEQILDYNNLSYINL